MVLHQHASYFQHELYEVQMVVAKELFNAQPKLHVLLPSYTEFKHIYNMWANILVDK